MAVYEERCLSSDLLPSNQVYILGSDDSYSNPRRARAISRTCAALARSAASGQGASNASRTVEIHAILAPQRFFARGTYFDLLCAAAGSTMTGCECELVQSVYIHTGVRSIPSVAVWECVSYLRLHYL